MTCTETLPERFFNFLIYITFSCNTQKRKSNVNYQIVRWVLQKYTENRKYVYDAVSEVRIRIRKELTAGLTKGKKKAEDDQQKLSELELLKRVQHAMSNARSERLNGKIQRFVSNNYGIKNKDFSIYRIAGYFS